MASGNRTREAPDASATARGGSMPADLPASIDRQQVEERLDQLEEAKARGRIQAAWRLCLLAEKTPAIAAPLEAAVSSRHGTAARLVKEWLQDRHDIDEQQNTTQSERSSTQRSSQVVVNGQFATGRVETDITVENIFETVTTTAHVRCYTAMVKVNAQRQAAQLRTYHPPEGVDSGSFRRQYHEALRRWTAVDDHPHVTTVYDYGVEPRPWMIVAYGSETLQGSTRLPPEMAVRLSRDIGRAVGYAHECGQTHLALDPQAVLLDRRQPTPIPRVQDIGMREITATVQGTAPVDRRFAAPEYQDKTAVDWTTDIFHLGALLYAVLTGQAPFDQPPAARTDRPQPPSTVVSGLPAELDAVVRKTLAPSKVARYETADEFVRDLQTVLDRGQLQ